jgi:hypothetical protein
VAAGCLNEEQRAPSGKKCSCLSIPCCSCKQLGSLSEKQSGNARKVELLRMLERLSAPMNLRIAVSIYNSQNFLLAR